MKELISNKVTFQRKYFKEEAIAYFTNKGDEYKLELLEDLKDGDITFIHKEISLIYVKGLTFHLQKKSKQLNY